MAATLAAVLAVRGRIVIAVLATLACAGAAAATAGTEAKPTAFNVRVTSSFVRHHITHVVRKKDETGCRLRNDIDTRQTIRASTREPVRMTLAEILRGGKGIVGLRREREANRHVLDRVGAGVPTARDPAGGAIDHDRVRRDEELLHLRIR